MTVLTFSRAQLSPADLAAFDAIATPNLERGLWSGIRRRTGRDYDRLLVTVPQIDQVLFSFERDREGTYRLFVHDGAISTASGSDAVRPTAWPSGGIAKRAAAGLIAQHRDRGLCETSPLAAT